MVTQSKGAGSSVTFGFKQYRKDWNLCHHLMVGQSKKTLTSVIICRVRQWKKTGT
jgi:hypothetical protein